MFRRSLFAIAGSLMTMTAFSGTLAILGTPNAGEVQIA
jgi:hypothetical protein